MRFPASKCIWRTASSAEERVGP
ncbi:MAG: hypothetical protein ACK47B_05040 [Armatimonadota bacterium]